MTNVSTIKHDIKNMWLIMCLYIEDMRTMGSNHNVIVKAKKMLKWHINIKDIGLADVTYGIKTAGKCSGIILTQFQYVENVLKRYTSFGSSTAKMPIDPDQHLVKNNNLSNGICKDNREPMYLKNCNRYGLA